MFQIFRSSHSEKGLKSTSRSWLAAFTLLAVLFLAQASLWRVAFLMTFGRPLAQWTFSELAEAFLLGFRFDLTIFGYFSILPILIYWIGIHFRPIPGFRKAVVIASALFFTLFQFFNIIDFGFYSFFQDRLNIMMYGFFEDDTQALISTMWKNYPVIWEVLFMIASFTFAHWTLEKILPGLNFNRTPSARRSDSIRKTGIKIAQVFALLLTVGIAARGSFGLFPLSEIDLGFSSKPFINALAFNSPRAFGRAMEAHANQLDDWNQNLVAFGYQNKIKQAFLDYADGRDQLSIRPEVTNGKSSQPHIVVILMESMGSYYLLTPDADLIGGLRPHLNQDLWSPYYLSSTLGTVGSLSSLMVGSVHRLHGAFLTESRSLQTEFSSAPARQFKRSGYQTEFIYGGNPGWREINKFALKQGFDAVTGENEIQASLGRPLLKHDWGIYDQDLWDYVLKKLQSPTPQFLLIMTTTNHPPYQLPPDYKSPLTEVPASLKPRLNIPEDQALARLKTYRYSNDQLGNLISQIKTSDLKDHTVLTFSGDHSFWIVNFEESEKAMKWSVPLYMYVPSDYKLTNLPQITGSQMDIWPTLYSLGQVRLDVPTLSQQKGLAMSAYGMAYNSVGCYFWSKPENKSEFSVWDQPLTVPGKTPSKEWPSRWPRCIESSKAPSELAAAAQPKLALIQKKYEAFMAFLDQFVEDERKREH